MEKSYSLEELEQAFEDGRRYENNELIIPLVDTFTVFEAWMNFRHPELEYKILKTSDEWQELWFYMVYDPDGWDRQNYQYSWFEEKITWGEFKRRAFRSTCISK